MNAKILPDGIASPHIAVINVRSLSGNQRLQIRLIAELNIGYARLIQAYPTKIAQNLVVSAAIDLNQQPVIKNTQPILITN
jgi:hypothetical protein